MLSNVYERHSERPLVLPIKANVFIGEQEINYVQLCS